MGVLDKISGAIKGLFGGAEAAPAAGEMAAAKGAMARAIEDTVYSGYRALTYAPSEEQLYYPSGVHEHSEFSHTWEEIPTNYQSTYRAQVWDDEAGEWDEEYYTIHHDDLLSEEEEESALADMSEESLGARSAWEGLEFVGGKTRWPEYTEI